MYLIGKVSIRTYITKDAIKIPTSEGQQKDIRRKIGFLGIKIDCDSGTVGSKVGLFFFFSPKTQITEYPASKYTSLPRLDRIFIRRTWNIF